MLGLVGENSNYEYSRQTSRLIRLDLPNSGS